MAIFDLKNPRKLCKTQHKFDLKTGKCCNCSYQSGGIVPGGELLKEYWERHGRDLS